MVNPSPIEMAEKLGITTKAKNPYYDLIIVGGGPAGLMASIYAAREGIEALIIDRAALGGQAGTTERLENFPAFPDGILGDELATRLVQQAHRFGVETLSAQEVASIMAEGRYRQVSTKSGDGYCAATLLLAPGSSYKRLGVPGEDSFLGAGIHSCATCDGPLYKGQEILVVGGGNSGVEEGIYLTKYSPKVTIMEHNDHLNASKILQDRAYSDPKIEVQTSTAVQEFRGENRLQSVLVKDLKTGEEREIRPGGVFVFIGLVPNTGFLKNTIELDKWGYIITGDNLETSMAGVFAAGDARLGSTKQVASAVGEGATAALMIRQYLKKS